MSKAKAQRIAEDLIAELDEWYSLPETWDNELDTQIHRWYAEAENVWPKRPYFSPSSVTACPRGLYYKAKKYPKDNARKQPHKGRWQAIGTAVGDIIQRDILAIERNLEDKTGKAPRFRFERTDEGTPMFEDFAKRNVKVTHGGESFHLYGTCDGIMTYRDLETGEVLRVGLEVKTKQTTPARTSPYSLKEPDGKHVQQCIAYAEMYQVDYYVILYVNAAKKKWTFDSDEEYEKSPDLRAFGLYVTDEDKAKTFDYLAEVQRSIKADEPLPLDPLNWTFNDYKSVIARDITDDELGELKKQKDRALHSNIRDFMKRAYVDCYEEVAALKAEAQEEGGWL